MRVVIAGFGPFPGAPSNPSARLAGALARRRRPALAGIEIASHVFATAYDAVDRDLPKLLARKPDVLLIFGLAGRRREICIETRARNARSILFPDAHGYRPDRRAIEAGEMRALQGHAPFPQLLVHQPSPNLARPMRAPTFAITPTGARYTACAMAGRWCSSCTYPGSVRHREREPSNEGRRRIRA